MTGIRTYKTQFSRRRHPKNQDNITQTLACDEWTSFSQDAVAFMALNYRRNYTQHRRDFADNGNRRNTNLQLNPQYTGYLRGLQTILIVDRTISKKFSTLKTLDLTKRLSTVKRRYQRPKEVFSASIEMKVFLKTLSTFKEDKPLKHAASLSTSVYISIKKEHSFSQPSSKPRSFFE